MDDDGLRLIEVAFELCDKLALLSKKKNIFAICKNGLARRNAYILIILMKKLPYFGF